MCLQEGRTSKKLLYLMKKPKKRQGTQGNTTLVYLSHPTQIFCSPVEKTCDSKREEPLNSLLVYNGEPCTAKWQSTYVLVYTVATY